MQDEEVTLDLMDETAEETVETPEETVEETSEVDVDQVLATNKKLFERAKKAEAELKSLKSNPAPASPQPNVEETVLLAGGMPEELVNELKAVASVRGVSLIKAQNDPIFVAMKETFLKEQKQKDASLGASRSSGTAKSKVDVSSPGLSREDHKRLALEAMN